MNTFIGIFKKVGQPNIFIPVLCLLIGIGVFFALGAVSAPPFLHHRLVFGSIAVIAMFSLCSFFVRRENASLKQFNLLPDNKTWSKFALGLLVGTLMVGLMLSFVFLLTDLKLSEAKPSLLPHFLIASLAIVPLALMEEILFRGYPLLKLNQTLNLRWVILLSSICFALYHYNGSQSLFSLLLGPGVWGVVFCIAAVISNSIAMPLGIHIAANFLQALVGLKSNYQSLWQANIVVDSSAIGLHVEHLGLALQLVLFASSMLFLELMLRRKEPNHIAA